MWNKKTSVALMALGVVGLCLLQATGGAPSEPDRPIERVIEDARFQADRATLFAAAETLSDKELVEELKNLRIQAEEESRWAQFLDWTMWYVRDSPDSKAHERWKSTWSKACNDLLGQTMSVLHFLDICFEGGELAPAARVHYSWVAAMLPQIREARLLISKGVLVDVYKMPEDSPRLEAWAAP